MKGFSPFQSEVFTAIGKINNEVIFQIYINEEKVYSDEFINSKLFITPFFFIESETTNKKPI